jgi:hypothetical protein
MIPFLIFSAVGAGILAVHVKVRQYTRNRLRFVDIVQTPLAPIVAGIAAAIVAAPVVWLLPIVGAATALGFGIGVGTGVLMGAKDVKRLPGGSA